MFDKDAIKKELIEGSNIILKRYDEDDVVDSRSCYFFRVFKSL